MKSTPEFHPVAFPCFTVANTMARMAEGSHKYLRVWREHRHLTQDQVVDRLSMHEDKKLPTSKPQLSKVENGHSPYSQRLLEALSDIYACETWELLGRDPRKENEVIDLWSRLTERDQAKAAAYMEGLTEANRA